MNRKAAECKYRCGFESRDPATIETHESCCTQFYTTPDGGASAANGGYGGSAAEAVYYAEPNKADYGEYAASAEDESVL